MCIETELEHVTEFLLVAFENWNMHTTEPIEVLFFEEPMLTH